MSKKFTNTDRYDAGVDRIWAMLTTRDYWSAKYEALGAINVRWTTFEVANDRFTISTVRDVPADLPSFARMIVGETNRVTQVERWSRSGSSAVATIEIAVKNVPGGTNGTMEISSIGAGSQWGADFDITVGLLLVGDKLEGIIKDQTIAQFMQEKSFNDRWLVTHA